MSFVHLLTIENLAQKKWIWKNVPQSKTNALSYVAIAFQPVAFIGIFLEYIVLFSVYLFPDIAMSDVLFGLVFDIEAVHHTIFGVCVGGADRKTTHTHSLYQ